MVICTISQKGGVSKTTTVATLARLWSEYCPLVIDCDPRADVARFKLRGVKVHQCAPGEVAAVLETARHETILIDCPPDVRACSAAINAAHLIIIPAAPEPFDLDAARKMLDAWPDKPARLLLTRYQAAYREEADKLARSRKYGKRLFATRINRSMGVVEAARRGQTILDYAPGSMPARQYRRLGLEIEKLWQ